MLESLLFFLGIVTLSLIGGHDFLSKVVKYSRSTIPWLLSLIEKGFVKKFDEGTTALGRFF